MPKDNFGLDPAEVKRQEEAQAKYDREQKLRIGDLRKVLSNPEGRRVIWRILEEAKVFAEGFSLNTVEMASFQGERRVGIRLLSDLIKAKPEAFYQMFCENKAKSGEDAKKEEATNGNTES